jgi:hypothetical protein
MKRLLPLFALLILALPLCGRPLRADVPANPAAFVWSAGSATSATGTLGPFPCPNANTGTFTFTTGGGAAFTVQTAADTPYSAAYATDTGFGTAGVITAPGANTQSSGALGGTAVLYVRATYTGNTGTIAGTFTCSGSITAGSSGGGATPIPTPPGGIYPVTVVAPTDAGGNVKVVQPAPSATQQVGCDTAAHCPVNASQVGAPWSFTLPQATASPNGGVATPMLQIATCANNSGTMNCASVSAGQNLGVVQGAAPAATTPVSCTAAANCPVNASQVTSPWVVTTINPSLPAPQATWPVTSPAPLASVSPVPYPAFAHLHIGSANALYLDTWPDTWATSANITTATTTLLVSGVASQSMYVFWAGWDTSGTNAAATLYLEWGQGATCATNTVKLLPSPGINNGTAIGELTVLYGQANGTPSSAGNAVTPVAVPLIIPANATAYNLCGVTAGTTIAGQFVINYAIHAN